ncbi:MAG: choice-of-anchor L domain-containing protein [Reyranella sp.]|uniref:choice-of-anchor L domain-containing protein n=1 Tax=Reyranella sp. TaxID=1929291 RepID=UPI003D09CFF3
MPAFTIYDGSDVTKISAALLASSSGITISNVVLNASGADAVNFYDGSLAALGIGAGLLLTSGTIPGTFNTAGWFGQDNSGTSGFANGDPNIDAVVNTVFQTQSYDATTLSFDFAVADPTATSISFDLVFGSDEFPEWVDQFVDCAVVMVNGVNYALFNHDPSHPLSVVSANLAAGYFQDNANNALPIEFDGVSHVLKIVAPISSGVTNHIKIGIADTGDHIYDSGLFLANLSAGNIPGSGVVVTTPTPCTDGSDNSSGTSKDEYFALLGGDDTCYAGGGDDIVDAGSGNDVVYAGSGADHLKGDAGNDSLDGGDGIDTAVYAGASAAYAIAVDGNGFSITDLGPTGEGTDTLTYIEQVKFGDGLFALGAGGMLTPVADPGAAPSNTTGSVVIAGIGSAGKKLMAAASDPDGISAPVTYQWQVSGDNGVTWTDVGASSNSYTITGGDVGQAVRVLASYVDDAGHQESLASAAKSILASKSGDLVVTLMHLDAPAGASVINPLTTLLQASVGLGVTPNVAALGVKAALGLPVGIDLGSYDAYAALQANPADPVALAVETVAVQVAILTSLSDDDTGVGLALALLDASAAGQTLDLANADDLSGILGIDIVGLSKDQYPQPLREIFDRNKSLSDAIGNGGTVGAIEAEWQDFLSIQDGVASTSIADLSIHVNQLPTGSASASLADGVANAAYGLAAVDLLQGFSDPEGNALVIAGLGADKGTVVDNGDGTFTIVLAPGYVGPVELSYMVVDGLGGSVPGSQLFIVAPSTPKPTVAISAELAAKPEGNAGTSAFTFVVSVDQAPVSSQTIGWSVGGSGNDSASASDFAGGALPSGIVTFAPGEISETITVLVTGDTVAEQDEGFAVELSNPSTGLTIGTASATGTIQNDDAITAVAAHNDAYIVQQGQSIVIPDYSLLYNDFGSSPLAAALLAGPAHGALSFSADGDFSYAPAAGFFGIDGFTYHASNGGSSADAQALLYVVPVSVGTTTTLNLLALSAEEQIAATYAAFFGRAADALGFEFWVGQFNAGLTTQGPAKLFANIASSFGVSDEAKALYPFLANPFGASDAQIGAFLDSVYENLFNRSSDAAGLAYWTGQTKQTLQAGQFVGSVLVDVMSGAQDTAAGKDITTLMGKVAVSLDYVHRQEQHNTAWAGASDIAAATNLLHGVTDDPSSVLTGIKDADLLIAAHA